ncbi:uncharacterized protein LOC121962620 isoform X2 [Plectropomus leopardus]|uniref:uncharacterized protein LOC121962620 isoform X2 n=1 Tax=Plectropomus leopardus TaxID=160734 RepID=UPI001C4D7B3E|nr:uncharacterized protein LOC121962620 isoform X2 [Plectropomus leopardus]
MWASGTACLCVLLSVTVSAVSEIYRKVGDEVVLKPDAISGAIKSITWKHGSDIAAQWDGTETDYYRQFEERGRLNNSTGEMTITGLTVSDSGEYTPEINNMVQSAFNLIVISPVPTPTIKKSCVDETSCVLSCDGDTTAAGPVTYSWKSDDDKVLGTSKEQHITKDNNSSVKEFSCEMKNKVSNESSAPLSNPFIITTDPPAGTLNITKGAIVFISLLIAVVLLAVFHRCKAGTWFFNKTSMPWEADFWKKNERLPRDAAESNGRTAQEKGLTDEETPMT